GFARQAIWAQLSLMQSEKRLHGCFGNDPGAVVISCSIQQVTGGNRLLGGYLIVRHDGEPAVIAAYQLTLLFVFRQGHNAVAQQSVLFVVGGKRSSVKPVEPKVGA